MKIYINDKETTTAATTLQELAGELQLPERGVAIAINNRMIPRSAWGETGIAEGERIVIIKAAYGG